MSNYVELLLIMFNGDGECGAGASIGLVLVVKSIRFDLRSYIYKITSKYMLKRQSVSHQRKLTLPQRGLSLLYTFYQSINIIITCILVTYKAFNSAL